MFAVPPRRLSTDRSSLFYDICYKRVGVRFNGKEMPNNVHEYNVDEGWVDVRVRRADGRYKLDEFGKYVVERWTNGTVEPYFKEKSTADIHRISPVSVPHDDEAAKHRAVDKQARKAAKRAAVAERNTLR